MAQISHYYKRKMGLQDITPVANTAKEGVVLSNYYKRKMGIEGADDRTYSRDALNQKTVTPRADRFTFAPIDESLPAAEQKAQAEGKIVAAEWELEHMEAELQELYRAWEADPSQDRATRYNEALEDLKKKAEIYDGFVNYLGTRFDTSAEIKNRVASGEVEAGDLVDAYDYIDQDMNAAYAIMEKRAKELEDATQAYENDQTRSNALRAELATRRWAKEYAVYAPMAAEYEKMLTRRDVQARNKETKRKMDELLPLIQEAKQMAERVMGTDEEDNAVAQVEKLQEKYRRLEMIYQQTGTQYFTAAAQADLKRIEEDAAALGAFGKANELSEDIALLVYAMQEYASGVTTQQGREFFQHLESKYGLAQGAIAAAFGHPPEDWENGSMDANALRKKLEEELSVYTNALKARGYNYDRMVDYARRLWQEKRANTEHQLLQGHIAESGWNLLGQTVKSVLLRPLTGLEYLSMTGQTWGHSDLDDLENYVPANAYDMYLTNHIGDIRSISAQQLGAFGGIYTLSTSMADSTVNMGLRAINPVLSMAATFGATAAETSNEILKRGGTNHQAAYGGAAAGAIEMLTEKYSVDKLLDGEISKAVIKEMLKQAAVEMSEEAIAEVMNIVVDAVNMGDKSQYNQLLQQYLAQGMSEEMARAKASGALVMNVLQAAGGGFFSGMVFGGAKAGLNTLAAHGSQMQTYKQIGERYRKLDENVVAALIQEGLAADPASQAYKLAQKLQGKIERGGTVSDKDIGRQVQANETAIGEGWLKEEPGLQWAGNEMQISTEPETVTETSSEIPWANNTRKENQAKTRTGEDRLRTEQKGFENERNIVAQQSEERQQYLRSQYEKHKDTIEGLKVGDKLFTNDGDFVAEVTQVGEYGVTILGEDLFERIPRGTFGQSTVVESILETGGYFTSDDTQSADLQDDPVQQLRQDYVDGRITEEEFDQAMDALMEEESASEMSMVDGIQWAGNEQATETTAEHQDNNTETEEMTYEEQRGQSAGRDEARLGEYPGGRTGENRESRGERVQRRSVETTEIRNAVKNLRVERTSLRKLGLSIGSDIEGLRVVPQSIWNKSIRTAADHAAKQGLEFVPVVGQMFVEKNGKQLRIEAAIENGRIYVQVDSMVRDVVEVTRHEIFHYLIEGNEELQARMVEYIREHYSEEEVSEIFDKYRNIYREFVKGMSAEKVAEYVWQEMLADAYAELERKAETAGTSQWTEYVREAIEQAETKNTASGGARMSAEADRYSYQALTQKPPIKVVEISDRAIPTKGKKLNKDEIAGAGRRKAAVLYNDSRGKQRYVYIKDLGGNVLVPPNGFKHGILGNKTNSGTMRTAEVTYDLVEILRNSIVVNELDARPTDNCEFSYVLFGYAVKEDGTEYVVKSTVNHYSDNKSVVDSVEIYDILKGSKAQNVEAKVIGSHTGDPAARVLNAKASTTISVAELLDAVKENYPELLPDSVREHYGLQDTPKEPTARFAAAGENALTADEASLQTAKDMLDMGEDMAAIREATGWYQGRDGKWRFEVDENFFASNKGNAYAGKNLAEDSEVYSYDFLVAQPDMQVVTLPEVDDVRNSEKRVDTATVIETGMKNARSVGTERDGKVYVKNTYTGRELRIDVQSIRHGLNGDIKRLLTNARLGAVIGDVVQRAIPVNALHDTAQGVEGTYAMVAYATDSRGREFVAIVTVEQRSGGVTDIELQDVTHAISGRQKKISSRADTKSQGVYPSTTTDKISIADLLDVVNLTYQSILSRDVQERLGVDKNATGYYTDQVKFSAATEKLTDEQREDFADWTEEVLGRRMTPEEFAASMERTKARPPQGRVKEIVDGLEEQYAHTARDGHLYKDPEMSDEEHARLDEKWQNRTRPQPEQPQNAEEWIIPKKRFVSTPAMEKVGVKIDGSVTRYRQTEQLRSYEKAARQAEAMVKARIRKLGPTKNELELAKLMTKGTVTADMLSAEHVDLEKVLELADYIAAAESFSESMVAHRREEIDAGNMVIAQELFQDIDDYEGKAKAFSVLSKARMNYREMERVCRKAFGDEQGEKIYRTYFRPVWVNGAEMNRFKTMWLEKVRKFKDQKGKARKLTVKERQFAQRIMEDEAVVEAFEKLKPGEQEKVKKAAEDLNNGKDSETVARDRELNSYLLGVAQAYADYMDTVELTKDMDMVIMKNAIETYRKIYNEFYDAINDFLVSHGYNEIGFIKNYAPHFQKQQTQVGLLNALKNMGVERVSELPASIAGRTADFKPNMRWNPHAQHREGKKTDYDILVGFENYLHYAAEMFYHTDDVMRIRQAVNWFRQKYAPETVRLAIEEARPGQLMDWEWKLQLLWDKDIVGTTEELTERQVHEKYKEYMDGLYEQAEPENLQKFSNFVMWMDDYANILAGKQSYSDRGQEAWGRGTLNFSNKLIRQFAIANVAGNLSSALNQTAQLPMIQSQLGWYAELAMKDMVLGRLRKENFKQNSDFLTDKRGVDRLSETTTEKFISALFKPATIMDEITATIAVRGRYLQALHEGMTPEQAMAAADDYGRRTMGSRMKGAKPIAFENKGFWMQMINQFQIEPMNQFDRVTFDGPRAVKAIAKKKGKAAAARYTAAACVGYLITAFLHNLLSEELYGGTPAPFDLLGWLTEFCADLWNETEVEWLKTIFDNAWEKMFDERLFDTEPHEEEKDGLDWAGAWDGAKYNLLDDVPLVRNISSALGYGDQSGPLAGVGEVVREIGSAGKTMKDQMLKGEEETGLDWAGAAKSAGLDLAEAATVFMPGGRQVKKSMQGIMAMQQGGKYKNFGDNATLQYPIRKDAWNAIRAGLFGLGPLDETDEFYAGGQALSKAQTKVLKELEELGVDRFVTYGLYEDFHALDDELTSIEEKNTKRDMIDALNLTDEQKMEVYLRTVAGASGRDTTRAKYEYLLERGVEWSQISQLENAYALLNADEDGDGEADMSSLERGVAKRNEIASLDLSDWQKLEVFDRYHLRHEENSYEETRAEFETMLDEGLSWAEITQAHNTYAEINADEDLSATQKATQYAKWVDEQDWTEKQCEAVKARYMFWQMIPAEAERYEKFSGAGLNPNMSSKLVEALNEAREDRGELENYEEYRIVVDACANDREAMTALSAMLKEEQFAKLEIASDYGVSADDWVTFKERCAGKTNQDTVEAVLDQMRIPGRAKAALWQICKNWSPKNNPYDRNVAQRIYNALN